MNTIKLIKVIHKFNLPFEIKEDIILNGDVKVNDYIIKDPYFNVGYDDVLEVNKIKVIFTKAINLALYKPKGYLSATVDKTHQVVTSLIPSRYKYYKFVIAGRLDLNSEGLLILTTNGKYANKIANPGYKVKKVYEVSLDSNIKAETIKRLKEPLLLKDGEGKLYKSVIDDIKKLSNKKVLLTISMGKYHQVRRMFLQLGYIVENLKRVKIGNISLKDLKEGESYPFLIEDLF